MQPCPDGFENIVGASEDIVVPEAEEVEATTFQLLITPRVMWALGVLATVRLNDELGGVADKVGDVWTHWNLASELEVRKTAVAQDQPKLAFGLGRFMTHRPCIA